MATALHHLELGRELCLDLNRSEGGAGLGISASFAPHV